MVSLEFVPEPHAWGRFEREGPDTYFLLTEYRAVYKQPAESDELAPRALKPSLIHGDFWDGNTAIDTKTGHAFIFDTCSFYGHNEYDTGNWGQRQVVYDDMINLYKMFCTQDLEAEIHKLSQKSEKLHNGSRDSGTGTQKGLNNEAKAHCTPRPETEHDFSRCAKSRKTNA
ncbi:hypothetical protein E2P81_ATG06956 [Venturia nashicola]|uniref:protein-ribulosamine 3-kinase n=1 Tax=Venturia nashicola TaxID=86259 RepID=A0A4Z1P690_9PEZI|nr:hypothetical protein E6O75_ATG07126 [Venturia nashicola]TLD30303.1 hypothetical protein E2P81_ATG06956 [Venturia nashicola]